MRYIKLYEKFLDFDEVWEEEKPSSKLYKIVKWDEADEDYQDGLRFFLCPIDKNNTIVLDFDTMETHSFSDDIEKLDHTDIKKILSGEYVITNGKIFTSNAFRYITYDQLVKSGIFTEDEIYDFVE